MKFAALREILEQHPHTLPRFILPDGDVIPSHAHVTEIGHVVKNFIDCGGLTGRNESVVLQTHVGRDIDHRLRADRFAKILQLGGRILPNDQLDVEIEYDCCVVAQYPVHEVKPAGEHLDVVLGKRRTQCLAQERRNLAEAETCCASGSAACCN